MAVIFALENLFDSVVNRFGVEGSFGSVPDPVTAAVRANKFGWREPFRQLGATSRIVWVPGDPQGDLGALVAPKYPGQNPRPLQNLVERFHVFISGADSSAPGNQVDERKQYHATRLLYDIWIRAMYLEAYGTFNVSTFNSAWIIDKNERRYGAAIRVSATIQAVITDSVFEVAPIDVEAHIVPTLNPNSNDPTLVIKSP